MRHLKPWRWGAPLEKVFLWQGEWRENFRWRYSCGRQWSKGKRRSGWALWGPGGGSPPAEWIRSASGSTMAYGWAPLCSALSQAASLSGFPGNVMLMRWEASSSEPGALVSMWKTLQEPTDPVWQESFLNHSVFLVWQNGHRMLMWLFEHKCITSVFASSL